MRPFPVINFIKLDFTIFLGEKWWSHHLSCFPYAPYELKKQQQNSYFLFLHMTLSPSSLISAKL